MSPIEHMVTTAARTLSARHAEACNVNEADLWNLESEFFKAEASAVLESVGVTELLDAMQEVLRISDRKHDAWDAAKAAIAKATGVKS